MTRDPYRRRRELLATSQAEQLAQEVRSTTSAKRSAEDEARITRLRNGLSPDEQTIIILRFDRGMSWREVARVLEEDGEPIEEAALRKRFERMRSRLRELAVSEGLVQR